MSMELMTAIISKHSLSMEPKRIASHDDGSSIPVASSCSGDQILRMLLDTDTVPLLAAACRRYCVYASSLKDKIAADQSIALPHFLQNYNLRYAYHTNPATKQCVSRSPEFVNTPTKIQNSLLRIRENQSINPSVPSFIVVRYIHLASRCLVSFAHHDGRYRYETSQHSTAQQTL